MNAIRQFRSAACPSLLVSTGREPLPLPPTPVARPALVCRWRLESDGRLSCVWLRADATRRRARHLAFGPRE